MACKPEWSDKSEEVKRHSVEDQLRHQNKIMHDALHQILRIGHPYGCVRQVAVDALTDIGEEVS